MADHFINIRPPLAGLNVDTSPSQIDDDESPELYNFLIHEPGQMRRRGGFKAGAPMAGEITAGSYPFNIMLWKNQALVGYMDDASSNFYATYFAPSPTEPLPGSGTRTGGTIRIFRLDASDPDNIPWDVDELVQNGTSVHTAMMPWGHTVQYEHSAYGCSAKPIFRADKSGNGRTATRLIKWAGSVTAPSGDFATINNGSTSGTFTGTPPANSIANCYIRFPSDTAPYRYSYQVKTHVGGNAAFELYEPYGLGENTTNVPNKTATAVEWVPIDYVQNSPIWCQCVAVHHERLFVGRPVLVTPVGDIQPGEYPNAVMYSEPTQPEKWNDTSLIVVDDRPDDAIMAFGHVGRNLVLFKSRRTYILSGYSPQTFTVHLVTAEMGCIDSRSVVQLGDGVAFMSHKGYYYLDSSLVPRELSQREPGHGIRRLLLPQVNNPLSGKQYIVSAAALSQDHLVLTNQETVDDDPPGFNTPKDSWFMYTKTFAWGNWGNRDAEVQPLCYSPANQYAEGRVLAAFPNFVGTIDSMFDPEPPPVTGATVLVTPQVEDQYYDANDDLQTAYVPVVCRTKDFRLWEGDTGRLRAMYVEHCIQYVDTSDPTQNGLDVSIDIDRAISESPTTVGTVGPEFEDALFDPDYDRYYVREFRTGGFQREAAVFRVRLSQENVSSGTTPPVMKWYNIRLLGEQTRSGRVQNSVTS